MTNFPTDTNELRGDMRFNNNQQKTPTKISRNFQIYLVYVFISIFPHLESKSIPRVGIADVELQWERVLEDGLTLLEVSC